MPFKIQTHGTPVFRSANRFIMDGNYFLLIKHPVMHEHEHLTHEFRFHTKKPGTNASV